MAACKVDVDVDAAVAQQVHQVLGGDVAGGARRERAAAQPADRRVQPGDARLDRRVRAGQPGAAGVVEMPAQWQLADHRAQLCDQRAHPSRRGRADGVGDARTGRRRDRRAAAAMSRTRCGWRGPFERAIPRGGDDDLDGDIAVVGDGDDLADLIGGLGTAASDVGVAECVAGRHHVFDRAQPGGDGPLGAVGAGDQRGEVDVGVVVQFGGELGRIGHRRHLRRGHERGGFNLAHPGRGDRCQQFQLGRQRDWLLDLQPVAQRYLANVDVRHSDHLLGAQLLELVGALTEKTEVDVVVVLPRACRTGIADTARRF